MAKWKSTWSAPADTGTCKVAPGGVAGNHPCAESVYAQKLLEQERLPVLLACDHFLASVRSAAGRSAAREQRRNLRLLCGSMHRRFHNNQRAGPRRPVHGHAAPPVCAGFDPPELTGLAQCPPRFKPSWVPSGGHSCSVYSVLEALRCRPRAGLEVFRHALRSMRWGHASRPGTGRPRRDSTRNPPCT